MPQIIIFLLGVITSATTSIGDKTQAAMRMVGLGHAEDIPQQYQYLLSADGTKTAVPVAAPTPEHQGAIEGWANAMASDHPIITLVLVVAVVFYVVYKIKSVKAVFARKPALSR